MSGAYFKQTFCLFIVIIIDPKVCVFEITSPHCFSNTPHMF